MLERPGQMQADRAYQHPFRDNVQARERRGDGLVLRYKRQTLAEWPPDRRKAFAGCMVNPACERHEHKRSVQKPVDEVCQPGFGLAIWVQRGRLGLCGRPENACRSDKEGGDAHRFVQREEKCLSRDLLRSVVGELVGEPAERNCGENQERCQPVEGLGDAAETLRAVGEGHDCSPVGRKVWSRGVA